MEKKFLDYLSNIKKYSDNTILNYNLDLISFNEYLKLKSKKINAYIGRHNLSANICVYRYSTRSPIPSAVIMRLSI